ncbi:glycosyltransferase [Actinospica durhamensis]|uniref:Hyaluronan synthase n=1 Tax=Actinospica durhamensis TaxID=1508375 RepID=A0A941ISX1_9ACTN|nr:glycosyltransferase family 2 protein [Actinospica durhamensis]MBR7836907.1 glycosyltransferase [Actinospica durhamensis]
MHALVHEGTHLHWYGATVGTLLGLKLLLSIRRRRKPELAFRHLADGHYIHGVVTVYNEAPAMLRRCLDSILAQTLLVNSLTVIDDCSSDQSCAALVQSMRPEFERAGVRLDFIRFPDNRGKRHGLAAGFAEAANADMYLCVDSDTVLDKHAVAELAEPFSKRRVQCVTGLVLAHNRSKNLLTRLIDMRYVNAFLGERVAYSRLGSVLCACGSLAMYRGWVVRKYVDDFLGQRFLGRPATFGDDRRLTYYCLTEGLSLIQPSSVGYTDVPERLGHYIRQQIRWGKSFIREGFLLFSKFRIERLYWWLNLIELATWVIFTFGLLSALVVIGMHPTSWQLLAAYLAYMCVMAWVRSIHYLRGAASVGFFDRIFTYLCAPLYAIMNLCLLLPLRIWSLATLRRNNWGTRSTVEVGEADSVEGAAPEPVTAAAPAAGPAALEHVDEFSAYESGVLTSVEDRGVPQLSGAVRAPRAGRFYEPAVYEAAPAPFYTDPRPGREGEGPAPDTFAAFGTSSPFPQQRHPQEPSTPSHGQASPPDQSTDRRR